MGALRSPQPRLRDVCVRTGLSLYTVSRALGGHADVSAETRRRVFQAAQELGYDLQRLRGRRRAARSSAPAQTGVGSARRRLGVVYPAGGGLEAIARAHHYGRYLRGIQGAAQELELDLIFLPAIDGDIDPLVRLMLGHPGGDGRGDDAGVERVARGGQAGPAVAPDGLVLLGLGDESPAVQRALTRPAPVVLLSRYAPQLPCSWVSVDHVRAAQVLTAHLLEQGYRSVLFAADQLDRFSWQQQRREGYRRALAGADLPVTPVHELALGALEPATVDHLERLVRGLQAPAIFAVNDGLALKLRDALRRRGLAAPSDFGLAGYDNVADALTGHSEELTSIGFPREEIGELAVHLVLQLCNRPALERQHVYVRPELHVRGSTRRLTP